jgi:hypothetical protein
MATILPSTTINSNPSGAPVSSFPDAADPSSNMSFSPSVLSSANTLVDGSSVAGILPARASNRVIVSLHASVSAQGDVDLIESAGESLSNVVVCKVALPVSDLYTDASNGIIEYWEPSGNSGSLRACITRAGNTVAGSDGAHTESCLFTFFDDASGQLRDDLHTVLSDKDGMNGQKGLNAGSATPFNATAYAATQDYYNYATFGDLVLANYAHYLFGHVAATAAIDNDQSLIDYINGQNADNSPVADANNANIAAGLVDSLGKMSATVARSIAAQVLSQDPSRASERDNTSGNTNSHQALLFAPGDIVYVQIQLKAPTVSVGNPGVTTGSGQDPDKPSGSSLPDNSTNAPVTAASPGDNSAGAPLNASGTPTGNPTNLKGIPTYPTETKADGSPVQAITYAFQITLGPASEE